ncbi:hypothetical protein K7432_017592 [Basidiobolus ranarum]|uniref:Uncharacterized protein n=1 Tax=Basidiobolus ranarum TaxID=34480 RepID=A0ABR2VL77_9FUNG
MLDTVFKYCNDFTRIPVCGMISQYNRFSDPEPIYNIALMLSKRIRFQGFIVTGLAAEFATQFAKDVPSWLKKGKMVYKEDEMEGIKNAPEVFIRIF